MNININDISDALFLRDCTSYSLEAYWISVTNEQRRVIIYEKEGKMAPKNIEVIIPRTYYLNIERFNLRRLRKYENLNLGLDYSAYSYFIYSFI